MNDRNKDYLSIIDHYEKCLEKYGDSHLGVDWPRLDDAQTRYQIMLDIIPSDKHYSLLDFGCGASHLYETIKNKKISNIEYSGLDISKNFFILSKQKNPNIRYYCLDILDNFNTVPKFDFIIANGVFTEKRELSYDSMFHYFTDVVVKLFNLANIGLAFNLMSSDVDYERKDLFHVPLNSISDFMCKKLSRNFVIRNDYGLYEYTVYLYTI
jgi:SAM-dependent methyltransferase